MNVSVDTVDIRDMQIKVDSAKLTVLTTLLCVYLVLQVLEKFYKACVPGDRNHLPVSRALLREAFMSDRGEHV